MQNCTIKYAVDLVFCIDGTRTMNDLGNDGQSILDTVKCVARSIGTDIYDIMSSRGQILEQLRARIIVFRDYLADGEHAMMVTDFFSIPQQVAEFEVCISSIHADGGGDIPEDGLEAMAYAIRSKWTAKGAR